MNNLPHPDEYRRFYRTILGLVGQSEEDIGDITIGMASFFSLLGMNIREGPKLYRITSATLVEAPPNPKDAPYPQIEIRQKSPS